MTESFSDMVGWRGDRILPSGDGGRFTTFSPFHSAAQSPFGSPSPHLPPALLAVASTALAEQEKYLNELLAERLKLTPFTPVLNHVYRLLNDEISRVTTVLRNASMLGLTGVEHSSPHASSGSLSLPANDADGWPSTFHSEICSSPSAVPNWIKPQGVPSGIIVKKTIRVDIPVDKFPYYNFVGRLLGPRGNSLKRVEANTECRVRIRGHGSIKDPAREEMMRGKPGYEHLNEPLHILVEAELPAEIIDLRLIHARDILEDLLRPMDESQDIYKKQQLRELALLNGTLREEGSASPMSSSDIGLCMKRAKTSG